MNEAYILNIGDEILIGQVVNTNASWLSEQLAQRGIRVVEQRVIGDRSDQILDAISDAHRVSDLCLITGGLGPTKDDITKKVLAEYFGLELAFDESLFQHITTYFKSLGRSPTAAHRQQCFMPVGATQLPNSLGTAPGMYFQKGNVHTISLPGVPYEMKSIMNDHVFPLIEGYLKGSYMVRKTIMTMGSGESRVAEKIEDIEDSLPSHISLAYLPHLARVRLRLTANGTDRIKVEQEINEWVDKITERLGSLVYGFDDVKLAQIVQNLALQRGLTVSIAESCTGGFVSHQLTLIPNASRYLKGGVVAYANEVKIHTLGVKQDTLDTYGAVSEQTVREMVIGVCLHLKTDIGLAISGIAGPSGGTEEKPVGTIWLAVGRKDEIRTKRLQLGKNRENNMKYAGMMALNLLRHFLMDR